MRTRGVVEIDRRRWGNQLPGPFGPEHLSPETYAACLLEYAAGRLDVHALRSWIAWRLIVDAGLDHDTAEAVAVATIAAERARREGRHAPHRRHRPHLLSLGRRLAA
jgi:hypothetical protein